VLCVELFPAEATRRFTLSVPIGCIVLPPLFCACKCTVTVCSCRLPLEPDYSSVPMLFTECVKR